MQDPDFVRFKQLKEVGFDEGTFNLVVGDLVIRYWPDGYNTNALITKDSESRFCHGLVVTEQSGSPPEITHTRSVRHQLDWDHKFRLNTTTVIRRGAIVAHINPNSLRVCDK